MESVMEIGSEKSIELVGFNRLFTCPQMIAWSCSVPSSSKSENKKGQPTKVGLLGRMLQIL